MPDKYGPQAVEAKWQQRWAQDGLYRTNDDDPRPKFLLSHDVSVSHLVTFTLATGTPSRSQTPRRVTCACGVTNVLVSDRL